MKKIIIFIPLLCLSIASFSQKSISTHGSRLRIKILKLADYQYENMNYAYAIPLYKAYLSKVSYDPKSIEHLSYSYYINHQYDSALKYYTILNNKGISTGNKIPELYAHLGDYNNAVKAYNNNGVRANGFKNYKLFLIDSLDYVVKNTIINTPYDEFANVYFNKGLIFESNRTKKVNARNEFSWNGSSFSNIYLLSDRENITNDSIIRPKWWEKSIKTTFDDLTFKTSNDNNTAAPLYDFKKEYFNDKNVSQFNSIFDAKFNAGAVSFTKDEKTAYFTRNQDKSKNIHQLEIWEVTRKDADTWNVPTRLSINDISYSNFHPAISSDGKRLYFASDRPGGFGKSDIYFIEKKSDTSWSNPINLGDKINTDQDELYPTINGDDLYISSNGQKGLGGTDIFKVDLVSKSLVNLGYPINSNGDDFSFITNGNSGFISSNRYGSDDILSFQYERKLLNLRGKTMINGGLSLLPIALYQVMPETLELKLIDSIKSNIDGTYAFKVRPNRTYKIVANENRENSLSTPIEIKDKDVDINMNLSVALVEKVLPKIDLNRFIVYYDLDKYNLTNAEKYVLDSVINKLKHNKELIVSIASFTDCAATVSYNIKLSKNRSRSVVSYLVKNGIDKNRITDVNLGEKNLVTACNINIYNETEQVLNRRTEILLSTSKQNFADLKSNDKNRSYELSSLQTRKTTLKKKYKGYKSVWGKEDK